MLLMIGAVAVSVVGFNVHEYSSSNDATFAEKSVVGRRPPLEAVGDGAETMNFSGRLFPVVMGGLDEVEIMKAQRAAQQALPVMRGDGVPLGWFVITKMNVKSQYLDRQGVGKYQEVEFTLQRSDAPDPISAIGQIISMLQ